MRQSQAAVLRAGSALKPHPRVVRRGPARPPAGPHADTKTFDTLHRMTMASIAKDVQRLKKKK